MAASTSRPAPREHIARRYALPESKTERAFTGVPAPRRPAFSVAELVSGEGGAVNIELLREHLQTEGRLHADTAVHLLGLARDVLADEPNLLVLDAPVVIVGDLHGQFFDLLQTLDSVGWPPSRQYLFLGDYVDRGLYSTEVALLLVAMKVRWPRHVFLLRGNHESRAMTEFHNAKAECTYKYNLKVYTAMMECFDALPLAATVRGQDDLLFLCMHGGLSPALETLASIDAIHRFAEIPASGPLCDLTWSDPLPDESGAGLDGAAARRWAETRFEFNAQRGCSFRYGAAAVREFCARNGLTGLIRAHEVQETGYRTQSFGETGRAFPLVTTVFSAPNYCEQYNNKAAVLVFDGATMDFVSFGSAGHPFVLPDAMSALTWSLPYVVEKCGQFFAAVFKLIEGDEDEDDEEPALEAAAGPAAATVDDAGVVGDTDRPDTPGADEDSPGFRSRTTRVRTTKRPTMRKRASSNIANELILTRRASMNTLIRKAREMREKHDRLLLAASDDEPESAPDGGAAADAVAGGGGTPRARGESRFDRATKRDALKEYLRPMQRHYTM